MGIEIQVDLSNRHVHLSEEDFKILFGEDAEFTIKKKLGKAEFAANETVSIVGSRATLDGVRIIGPCRRETQVELLAGDCRQLGITAPVLESVSLGEAGAVTLRGPAGTLKKEHAAIVAHRHIHLNETVGRDQLGLVPGQVVKLKVPGIRGLVFDQVLVRMHAGPVCVAHLDVEEGNAAGCRSGDMLEIVTE